ncbi:protease [Pseudoalteromonas sp. GCY]|uniref:type 1 glutamine amidotransferase domain-containing protein n=1 Tax=Pseudoalteromonas sp. GCY TaxID=2003316 RepID=UPI000BFEDC7D|nr:type 1 glutamine amidotransferase domain-containing protein [Pseudoalteromonas sp. GCY]PHI35643.1 protease [Pseudoalteromonas sp. GCY]QQQ65485.1 type 1 glutamine amidotransferase [Pseudoalteromonas sp. GCY]
MTESDNISVAILATDGFEQSELIKPKQALESAGFNVDIISLKKGDITAWDEDNWGEKVAVDLTLDEAIPSKYAGLVLPGGLFNPDKLRQEKSAVKFIQAFSQFGNKRPIAAICHGPWLLIEAQLVEGKTLTSFPSIKTDLKNAGADWIDLKVAVDDNLITSRNPNDLDAFNEAIIEALQQDTIN